MKGHQWAHVLAYVSGLVNQELLFQVEYLTAENRILRTHLPDRLRLSNDERSTLAEIGNVLRRRGIAPAPKRSQTTAWKDFIAAHMAVITGMDFFTVKVMMWRGLITYYVLFMIQLETRIVMLAGVTRHPTEEWIES